ncbi:MAG: hypothetical protein H7X97_02960 [Opitutaceae bacterium]|nr:hypothetical protein [Verrucomicrobiales bacterium]
MTHDLAQARRVADDLATITVRDGAGEIAGHSSGEDVFGNAPSATVPPKSV